MAMEPLEEKFVAFGYAVRHVDGNNVSELAACWIAFHLNMEDRVWFWRIQSKVKA